MKTRYKNMMISLLTLFLVAFLATPVTVLAAESTVDLGTAASFAVLAGETITNTGDTTIGGDVGGNIGVSPGTAVTGFPPGSVSDGTIHSADGDALQAQADLVIAYDDAAGRLSTEDLSSQNLGGMTLTSGVYSFSSEAQLTGTLTLDAQGDPEAVFIFQITSALTTASNSKVSLVNGARFCRVFWQVGSSATLGTDSEFIGHVFAKTSIAAQTGAAVQGQLLARNGAVTLDNNHINNGNCEAITGETTTTDVATETTTTGAATDATTETAPTDAAIDTTTMDAATKAITADDTTEATTTGNEELPKTGESNSYVYLIVILLGLAGVITYVIRRRQTR